MINLRKINKKLKQYLVVFLFTILYYLGYNSIAFVTLDLVERYLGLDYIYVVNTFTFVTVVIILVFINRKNQVSFNVNTSFFRTFLFVLGISIFFKLFKDPILSLYEILGIEDIPNIQKESFVIIHQVFHVLYFVILVSVAEEIMFRGII